MSELKKLKEYRYFNIKKDVDKLFDEIKKHIGKSNESNPDQWGDVFAELLFLSNVPKNDLERYTSYVLKRVELKVKEGVKNDN